MGWATAYIHKLREGHTIQCRPRGHSMKGLIASGQLCTIEPVTPDTPLGEGDIVLCKVHGCEYLHLIKATRGEQYQIGNNRGGVNGWVTRAAIAGVCTQVE